MGRREWERGEFVIPSAAWAGFKRSLREAYNKAVAADFELAKRVHERVKAAQKGKRNVDWSAVVWAEIHAEDGGRSGAYGTYGGTPRYDFKAVNAYKVQKSLLHKDEATGKVKLAAPKAKDYPPAKTDTRQYAADEGYVILDDERRVVKWVVNENKNACEMARESLMGGVFFDVLGKVKWTRGSGGAIFGNDEYSEDSGREYAGGGGSYLKDRFGPLGDDAFERQTGFRPRKLSANRPVKGSREYYR